MLDIQKCDDFFHYRALKMGTTVCKQLRYHTLLQDDIFYWEFGGIRQSCSRNSFRNYILRERVDADYDVGISSCRYRKWTRKVEVEPYKWSFHRLGLEIAQGFALGTVFMLAELTGGNEPCNLFQASRKVVPLFDTFVCLGTPKCPDVMALSASRSTACWRLRGTINSMCGTLPRKTLQENVILQHVENRFFPKLLSSEGVFEHVDNITAKWIPALLVGNA